MSTELVVEDKYNLATTEGKHNLAEQLLKTPYVPNAIVHRFGPGVYIREATYPAQTLIVGQEHVGEHINMLLKGSINVLDDNGNLMTLHAPYMFVAKPGSKIGFTLTEVVWQNIYATTETDVETLEKTLFVAPKFFTDHINNTLIASIEQYQEDRDDFDLMLKETGWDKNNIEKVSHYRDDCIPFPYGNYSIISGESPIQGKGMFATAYIRKNETIAPMRLNGKRTPAGYLVNHSKNPNSKAVLNSSGDMYLVAVRTIEGMRSGKVGEEITLDYRQVMLINNLWDGENKCQQE
jgi:hypothetical protein